MPMIDSGSVISARQRLTSLAGAVVPIPDERRLVHLQFRRFAGCPVCNLHLRSFARRHAEIEAAGMREVIVFHSGAAELTQYAVDLPFDVIPDPDKRLYAAYGVASSLRALLDPRAWIGILIAILHAIWEILRGRASAPSLQPQGGRWGLPADFLIASDGRVVACKYGEHADDHWSVDEVLELALSVGRAEASIRPPAGRVLSRAAVSAMAVLLLTIVHHGYGATIYDAAFRSHVVLVAIPLGILIGSLLYAGKRYATSRAARSCAWLAVALILLPLTVMLGLYEGGYNHLAKNVLFFAGGSPELMRTLYPGSLYEMPNDVAFEVTGVLQLPVAMIAGRDAIRLALRLIRA